MSSVDRVVSQLKAMKSAAFKNGELTFANVGGWHVGMSFDKNHQFFIFSASNCKPTPSTVEQDKLLGVMALSLGAPVEPTRVSDVGVREWIWFVSN